MADTYNKFLGFTLDLGSREHQLNTDTHRVALSNTLPVNTNTILANITQIANGNGYTTLGSTATNTYTGTNPSTCSASQIVWTSSGAGMATFQYAVYYSNATNVTLVNPLIAWWTRAAGALTLAVGETFTWKPNSLSSGTVFTIT